MKKILYSLLSLSFILASCSKEMDDIDNEISKIQDQDKVNAEFIRTRPNAPEAYTLTDADYELSSDEDVAKYKSFSSYKPAKDFLPEILYSLFSGEDAQALMTTYDYYSKPVVDEANARMIKDGENETVNEYAEMGQRNTNFDDEDEAEALIGKLLDRKDYTNTVGEEKTVSYTLYEKNLTNYIRVNADKTSEVVGYDENAEELTHEQYDKVGAGKYNSFYTQANALSDLITLADLESATLPITYSCIVYKNYNTEYIVYLSDGMKWMVKQSVMPVAEELNYALNDEDISLSYWWADPAIKITLGADDYELYPETSKYGNFDLRSGKVPGTDVQLRVDMLGNMLDTNHSPIIEGEQYLVSYVYYDGGSGVGQDRIVKKDGSWTMYVAPAN